MYKYTTLTHINTFEFLMNISNYKEMNRLKNSNCV